MQASRNKKLAWGRAYYKRTFKKRRAATAATQKKCFDAWMKIIVLAGKDKCLRCGYNKFFGAIDFHHRDPKQKRWAVGTFIHQPITSERLLELEKCDSMCRNCHAEFHIKLRKGYQKEEVI